MPKATQAPTTPRPSRACQAAAAILAAAAIAAASILPAQAQQPAVLSFPASGQSLATIAGSCSSTSYVAHGRPGAPLTRLPFTCAQATVSWSAPGRLLVQFGPGAASGASVAFSGTIRPELGVLDLDATFAGSGAPATDAGSCDLAVTHAGVARIRCHERLAGGGGRFLAFVEFTTAP